MPKVHFVREGKTLEIRSLTPLWNATKDGIQFVEEPNCGGQGKCQKCKCLVNGKEKLSCIEKVYGDDLEVETMVYYKNS